MGVPTAHCTTRAASDASSHASVASARSPSRPIQLRGWLLQLAGWVECRQEGVVLSCAWQRMPQLWWWLRPNWNDLSSVRLQRGFRKLAAGLECGKEGVVLHKCWEGMPDSSGRVCLSDLMSTSGRGAFQMLARVCHLPVSETVATRHKKQLGLFSTGGLRSSERTTPRVCAGV